MTMLKNSQVRYGGIAMAFHWLMALLLIALLALGLYMVGLPDVSKGPNP